MRAIKALGFLFIYCGSQGIYLCPSEHNPPPFLLLFFACQEITNLSNPNAEPGRNLFWWMLWKNAIMPVAALALRASQQASVSLSLLLSLYSLHKAGFLHKFCFPTTNAHISAALHIHKTEGRVHSHCAYMQRRQIFVFTRCDDERWQLAREMQPPPATQPFRGAGRLGWQKPTSSNVSSNPKQRQSEANVGRKSRS